MALCTSRVRAGRVPPDALAPQFPGGDAHLHARPAGTRPAGEKGFSARCSRAPLSSDLSTPFPASRNSVPLALRCPRRIRCRQVARAHANAPMHGWRTSSHRHRSESSGAASIRSPIQQARSSSRPSRSPSSSPARPPLLAPMAPPAAATFERVDYTKPQGQSDFLALKNPDLLKVRARLASGARLVQGSRPTSHFLAATSASFSTPTVRL